MECISPTTKFAIQATISTACEKCWPENMRCYLRVIYECAQQPAGMSRVARGVQPHKCTHKTLVPESARSDTFKFRHAAIDYGLCWYMVVVHEQISD